MLIRAGKYMSCDRGRCTAVLSLRGCSAGMTIGEVRDWANEERGWFTTQVPDVGVRDFCPRHARLVHTPRLTFAPASVLSGQPEADR